MSHERGMSLIELLLVLAVVGIITVVVVPQLLMAYDRSRQRSSMADMRSIASAGAAFRVDNGDYPAALADLEPDYMNPVPPADSWGNAWDYGSNGIDYTLTSYGSDGVAGPAPPAQWQSEPYEADLVVQNGTFTQAPGAE